MHAKRIVGAVARLEKGGRSPTMRMVFPFMLLVAIALGAFAGSMQKPVWASDTPSFPDYTVMQDEEPLINRPANRKMWTDYYATYVRVRLGQEQRLSNGVSWRLLIDQRTGIAMPRITWMPDKKSMGVANRMLDALHGRAVQAARAETKSSLESVREIMEGEPSLELSDLVQRPFDRSVVQADIALTYATASLVSLVDFADVWAPGANYFPRSMRGLILDLRRDLVFSAEACPGRERYDGMTADGIFFQLDGLLQFCDKDSLYAFHDFIHEKAKPVLASAAKSLDPFIQRCRRPYLVTDQSFVFFLTFGGLAIHATEYLPTADIDCALRRSSVGTFVIPYRDLELFMKRGPMRDELLRQ